MNLASLSICGRLTLNMHSLNNEGGEGNQILTRQVTVVDKEGNFSTVNAVSGDMLKHIQAEHFWNIAVDEDLKLCSACTTFDSNKISAADEFRAILRGVDIESFDDADKEEYVKLKSEIESTEDDKVIKELKKKINTLEDKYIVSMFEDEDKEKFKLINDELNLMPKSKLNNEQKGRKKTISNELKKLKAKYKVGLSDAEKLSELLKMCSLDDIEGVLVTAEGNNLPRKSCSEFGWLIGLPGGTKTENHFHVKLVSDSGSIESGEGANLGQNIFHRPANSGVYALVSNFDICRVGYNDITKKYVIGDPEREKRAKALLKSILYTFIKPKGAMRNTQNPHIVDFVGIIALSQKAVPAPTISPVNEDFNNEITKIAESINKVEVDSIIIKPFSSLADFAEQFSEIILKANGYKLKEA